MRPSAGVVAAIFAPALLVLALTATVSNVADIPYGTFTRDPVATLRGHALTGVQSHIGVLVWWAAAVISAFAAAVVGRGEAGSEGRSFFVWAGAVTAVLALDDLFLFHEELAPFYLGVDQKLVVLTYGLAIIAYLVRFRRYILTTTEYPLLAAALVLFAFSTAVDLIQERWDPPLRIFLEDGFKLLGIASWSGYLARVAYQEVRRAFAPR